MTTTTAEQRRKAQNKRKKAERDAKRARGLIRVESWVKEEDAPVLKAIVERMNNGKM